MKKGILIVMALVFAILSISCEEKKDTTVNLSKVDYSSELEINSPEGLAKESSLIYQEMVNEVITTQEGFERLLKVSCESTVENLKKNEAEFKKEIRDTISYLKSNDDSVVKFVYAETEFKDENTASIRRIQVQKNGKKYFFQQDYVKENDVWKIKGDNIIDDFQMKKRFLFWYI